MGISENLYKYLAYCSFEERSLINKRNREKQIKKDRYYRLKYKIHCFARKCNKKPLFSVEDLINKYGENTKCYLTGKDINLLDTSNYHFDHFIPIAKGGNCDLDNLRVCSIEANRMKTDLLYEDFLDLCLLILKNAGKL